MVETGFYTIKIITVIIISTFPQGLTFMIFGTTLLDVANYINVGVSIVSLMFFVRAVGSIIGTVGAGFLLDHFPRLQNTWLCLFTLAMVVGIFIYYRVPQSNYI